MLLLPGSLPPDRATLAALCDGLTALPEIASRLHGSTVTEYLGSWSDGEREASGETGDLRDGVALAQEVLQAGDEAVSVAVATPLHAALGLTDLTPLDPSTLSISADESRALCEAADAHMRDDGMRLHFVDGARWLVTCDRPIEVLTERPDWIIGELLRPNLPRGRDARLVERWMNELQMCLHAHPVNIAREERRLPPVNLVWLWGWSPLPLRLNQVKAEGEGAGRVTNQPHSTDTLTPTLSRQGRGGQSVEHGFANAMRNGNLQAWQTAWANISRELLLAQTILIGDSRPRLRLTDATPSITSRQIGRAHV